jgi:diacylglycerol kinase (ATP)
MRSHPNAKVHAFISVSVTLAGIWLGIDTTQWGFIVLAMAMVWITEFLNTSLEAVVDLVSPHHHRLAMLAKDVSAAAVVIAALAAVVIGVLVFGPLLWERASGWLGG